MEKAGFRRAFPYIAWLSLLENSNICPCRKSSCMHAVCYLKLIRVVKVSFIILSGDEKQIDIMELESQQSAVLTYTSIRMESAESVVR
jgi:hypothetical protein